MITRKQAEDLGFKSYDHEHGSLYYSLGQSMIIYCMPDKALCMYDDETYHETGNEINIGDLDNDGVEALLKLLRK